MKSVKLFALLLAACSAGPITSPANAGGAIVFSVSTSAVLAPANGAPEKPALPGDKLAPGDAIRPAHGGEVVLLLDGKPLTITDTYSLPGSEGTVIPGLLAKLEALVSEPAEPTTPGAVRATTGPVELLEPVDTALDAPFEKFLWKPVPGARHYRFTLTQADGTPLIRREVKSTELSCQDTGWQPESGRSYRWSVSPDGATTTSVASFEFLPGQARVDLQALLDALALRLAPPEPRSRLLLAQALACQEAHCLTRARALLREAAGGADRYALVARACLRTLEPAGAK